MLLRVFPYMSAPFTIPDAKFEAFMFETPDPLDAIKRPWTLSPERVPTDVMFDWAPFVTL
jgi:hypothetical protein